MGMILLIQTFMPLWNAGISQELYMNFTEISSFHKKNIGNRKVSYVLKGALA